MTVYERERIKALENEVAALRSTPTGETEPITHVVIVWDDKGLARWFMSLDAEVTRAEAEHHAQMARDNNPNGYRYTVEPVGGSGEPVAWAARREGSKDVVCERKATADRYLRLQGYEVVPLYAHATPGPRAEVGG